METSAYLSYKQELKFHPTFVISFYLPCSAELIFGDVKSEFQNVCDLQVPGIDRRVPECFIQLHDAAENR